MSSDTGDTSSRLSNALDDIFSRRRTGSSPEAAPGSGPGAGASVASNGAYQLPEIVPATEEPTTEEPTTEEPADAHGDVAPTRPQLPVRPAAAPAPAPAPAAAPRPSSTNPPSGPAPATPPATGWGDHMPTATVAAPSAGQLRSPGRRPRVRRVTRVLRHVDPWSTFKIALLFSGVAYLVALTSGVLLWRVADATGTLDNVERWFTQFGWETFELKGGEIFHNAWVIGLFGVVFATGAAVLLVTLFNLVSDIVGGIRMTVLEEEVVERTISSTRRYVVRNPASEAAAKRAAPAWSVDDDASSPAATADEHHAELAAESRSEPSSTDDTREHPAAWSVD